jgi:urease accessory protein
MIKIPTTGRTLLPPASLAAALLLAVGSVLPVQAHHLMDLNGLTPTPMHGLLSGLAHPVLGPDHFMFLLALALLGLRQQRRWILGLLAVALAGSAFGLLMPGLPGAELLLSATLSLEALVLMGWLPGWLLLPAIAVHGYALSGPVIGWSAMPVATYLLGLMLSQGLLLLSALALLRPVAERLSARVSFRRALALGLVAISATFALAASLA